MAPTHKWMIPAAALSLAGGTLVSYGTTSRNGYGTAQVTSVRARLAFAKLSPDGTDIILGATEGDVYVFTRTAAFAWETPDAGRVPYFYQVTTKPFPQGIPTRDVPGLVAGGMATPGSFTIDMVRVARLGGSSKRTHDFFIRIVPVINGTIVGPASNAVVLHFILGVDPNAKIIIEDLRFLRGDTVTGPPRPKIPQRAP